VYANAIPQVEPPNVGVHLLWSGPHTWVYSPVGWNIQRRPFHGRRRVVCHTLTPEELATLRARRELQIEFGVLTDRMGACPARLPHSGNAEAAAPGQCEIITLELDSPQSFVRVQVAAKTSFVVGLRDGKPVAGGREVGSATHELAAFGIDTVVLYARSLGTLTYCIGLVRGEDEEWEGVPVIARLQLPMRETMPSLDTPDKELAEAESRLLPGESLEADEFRQLIDLLRELVRRDGPPRPLDLAMLLRAAPGDRFDELAALDPLRSVLPHPRWRRVLGFSYFDRDSELVPGQTYEYRVTGWFPGVDLADTVYGFHTIPAETPLPSEFYLHGLRLRLPQPSRVELASVPSDGTRAVTRRGMRLSPQQDDWWLVPDLQGWSLVVDFPTAVRSVILELAGPHTLTWAAGAAWTPWAAGSTPVPPSEGPRLDFPSPVHQLRLGGEGFLCALRIPGTPAAPDKPVPVSRVLPPVLLKNLPPPPAPVDAGVENLQQPQPVADGDVPAGPAPARHDLGFEVRWEPALLEGIVSWPADLPAPPLVEATLYQLEHRLGGPSPSPWEPVLPEENFMTGQRDDSAPPVGVTPGVDLMQVYPEIALPGSGSRTVFWQDVFDFPESGDPVRRPVPEPGTLHRYRVRAVDPIGRPSDTWRETDDVRLEKWVPPPLPAGPDPAAANKLPRPTPTGVHARILVRDAPDLTAQERALLGTHDNAVLLRWGWHEEQRDQDPFATEFRVYTSRDRLDGVRGAVSAVTPHGDGLYDVEVTLERAVAADAAAGLVLDAGYPFGILNHTGGTAVTAAVITRVPLPGGDYAVPRTGDVLLPLRLTPDRTRTPAWGPRVEIKPITAERTYESDPMFDLFDLSADQPSDEAFVGVSAADSQPYVPDPLAPLDSRPGNESAIVAVHCEARFYGRPEIVDAPALDPVPVVVTAEPAGRPMQISLDVTPLLPGSGLGAGNRVRLERVSDDEVFRAYRVDNGRLLGRILEPVTEGDSEVEVVVPNAADRAAVLAALTGPSVRALEDRFVVFLAASHPYKARLFQPAVAEPVTLPVVADTLPNRGARWVYRARRADAAGRLSSEAFTLRGIVRVPSTAGVAVPVREERQTGDPPNRLRVRVEALEEVTHLLTFRRVLPASGRADDSAELLRVPSASHLTPGDRVRVRLRDGTLLLPEVKPLTDPDVETSPPYRRAVVDVPAAAGERVRVWACALTRDGVASPLAGQWTISMPRPPLAAPVLSVADEPPDLVFSWTWPATAETADVVLERSPQDGLFERISPPLGRDVTSFRRARPPGSWRYRLRALALDRRMATSNVIEV
jgi:hypothetical protein